MFLTRIATAAFIALCALATSACSTASYKEPEVTVSSRGYSYILQRGTGYTAHVHRAEGPGRNGRAPAVILIGGSGGGIGWQDYVAALLAKRGINAMAVAYFAMDSLPNELDRIPMEAFDRALAWLSNQHYVDNKRLGMGALSKGAEAALLLASAHPEIKAVGLFVPSGIVFQSVTGDFRKTSSWTRNGAELPFVPYGNAPRGSPISEYYREGLKSASPELLAAATIPVERMNARLLLLSSADDKLYASGELAAMIVARLKERRYAHPVESIIYPDAGHLISSIRADDVTLRGGTKAGNDFAQADGQQRFLSFFQQALAGR